MNTEAVMILDDDIYFLEQTYTDDGCAETLVYKINDVKVGICNGTILSMYNRRKVDYKTSDLSFHKPTIEKYKLAGEMLK